MSHKVVTLVYSRRAGSAHRKSILAYMADRASDDGRGVFCSKGTISDETEIARSTVFKVIRELVREGVLIEAGMRACKNGSTVVYDLNLEVILGFPKVKIDQSTRRTSPPDGPVQLQTSPSAGPHQSVSRTPTGPSAGPKPSLEPSLNTEAADGRARDQSTRRTSPPDGPVEPDKDLVARLTHALGFDTQGIVPKYWIAPDAFLIVSKWQSDLGLTPEEIIDVATGNMRAHGSPANGPKVLTRHMQDFAAAKALQLSPTPIEGAPHERNLQPQTGRRGQTAAGRAHEGLIAAFAGTIPDEP